MRAPRRRAGRGIIGHGPGYARGLINGDVGMSESKETGGVFALGALLGAAIGAALGLLYAPRRGVEMRREVASRSEDLRQRAREVAAELEVRSEQLRVRVRELAEQSAWTPAEPESSAGWGAGPASTAAREAGPVPAAGWEAGPAEPDLPPGEDLL